MKYIHWTLLTLSFGFITAGIIMQISGNNPELMPKFYGFGTLLLFIVWMPFFLLWRSAKTKLFDEILPKEEESENQSSEE